MPNSPDDNRKIAALIRTAAKLFGVPDNAIVKVQREGGKLVPIRLDELLRRMERGPK